MFTLTVSLGLSGKDQGIQGEVKRKRKKCRDQDKAGELKFSFQSLMSLTSLPRSMFCFVLFFWIVSGIFHFWAKHTQNSVKFESQNRRCGNFTLLFSENDTEIFRMNHEICCYISFTYQQTKFCKHGSLWGREGWGLTWVTSHICPHNYLMKTKRMNIGWRSMLKFKVVRELLIKKTNQNALQALHLKSSFAFGFQE